MRAPWRGVTETVLLPKDYFFCPVPPTRGGFNPAWEFGAWLLMAQCAYQPAFAPTPWGMWLVFDPPDLGQLLRWIVTRPTYI